MWTGLRVRIRRWAAACLLMMALLAGGAAACTSYIVAGGASADGSVLIARNDDGEGAVSPSSLVYHPPRDHPALFRSNFNKFAITLPAPGLAYFSLPSGPLADPATGRNTSGEAAGWNSVGVAVSATESIYNKAAALAVDPLNEEDGIIEDAIVSVLLPQATSARHAVRLLGDLVTRHAAGEPFGVLAADAHEAWYLETASGHHWLAQRVPRHSFFIAANQGRFQEVDLEDTDSVLASPGLLDFAVSAGLYDPSGGAPFNFFSAFMRDGPADANYSHPRVCLLQRLWGAWPPSPGCADMLAQPTFLRPEPRPISVQDVRAAMRNHWDGTPHDPYTRANPHEPWRPIALLRTSMGHVTQLRPASHDLPDALSIVTHVTLATPKLSPFIPLYKGLLGDDLPPELTAAQPEKPDDVSLFWRARRLQALVFQDYARLAPPVSTAILAFEHKLDHHWRPAFERRYTALLAADGEGAARRELRDFTAWVVRRAGRLLDGQARRAARLLSMPDVPPDGQWLRMLEEVAEAYAFEPTSEDGDRALPGDRRGVGAALTLGSGGQADTTAAA